MIRLALLGTLFALGVNAPASAQAEAGQTLDPVPPPPAEEPETIPPPPESTLQRSSYVPPQHVAAMHLQHVDSEIATVDRELQRLRDADPTHRRGRRFFWGGVALGVPTIGLGATSFIFGLGVALSVDPSERFQRVFRATLGAALPLLAVTVALMIRGIRLQREVLRPARTRRSELLRERKLILRDLR